MHGLSGICQALHLAAVKRVGAPSVILVFMSLSIEAASEAFTRGYHSEAHGGATHAVHTLQKDAETMAAFTASTSVAPKDIKDALVYGVIPGPYPDTEQVLEQLAGNGDSLFLWTTGDPTAQVQKVRNLGWEGMLRNPKDPGNFIVYASQDKQVLLPGMVKFAHGRGHNKIFIVDDSRKQLEQAITLIDGQHIEGDVTYVWMNRTNAPSPQDAQSIYEVTSLTEYAQLVARTERSGETATHILDLDGTLIDPSYSESSRREAVVKLLTQGVGSPRRPRPHFRPFNGFYALDTDAHFLRLTSGEITSPDFAGHQAHIYETNGSLVKVYAAEGEHRPQTPEWSEAGGYRGAEHLASLLRTYRNRLKSVGFPVPTDGEFLLARNADGMFFVVEVVPNVGRSMQETFMSGTVEKKLSAAKTILEISHPVLMTDGLGADIKPANFVQDDGGTITHIDPLPVIMYDEKSKTVYTEWPPIGALDMQQFLYDTHLTPLAIGCRFYQELCQIDPGLRSGYQQSIREVLVGWEQQGKLSRQMRQAIDRAMVPDSSRLLQWIIDGDILPEEGFGAIEQFFETQRQKGEHPIYALREMGFLLSEQMLQGGHSIEAYCVGALDQVESALGQATRQKIEKAIGGLPEPLRFLTIIRKLTHLSNSDWSEGSEEYTAWQIIKNTARSLA